MKPSICSFLFGRIAIAVSLLFAVLAPAAYAVSLYDTSGNFTWGNASQFEILTLGSGTSGGFTLSAPSGSTGYEITGNVGIAGTSSNFNISGSADVNGTIYLNTGDKVIKSGAATISGATITNSGTLLNSAATSAINISSLAASATQTNNWIPDDLNLGSNATLTLNSTGHFVMNLDDLILGGGAGKAGAVLTLNGGVNSTFIFNINGDLNVGGGAKILLTGGIRASDVIFNLIGCDSNAQITGDALVNGTILAVSGSVLVSGHDTQINGQIIAQQVCIQSGADADKMSP